MSRHLTRMFLPPTSGPLCKRTLSLAPHLRSQAGPDRILPATSHRAWQAEAAVVLRLREEGPQAMQPLSVPSFMYQQVNAINL